MCNNILHNEVLDVLEYCASKTSLTFDSFIDDGYAEEQLYLLRDFVSLGYLECVGKRPGAEITNSTIMHISDIGLKAIQDEERQADIYRFSKSSNILTIITIGISGITLVVSIIALLLGPC